MIAPSAAPVAMVGGDWDDYGLIDSGGGRKLEHYGRYRFVRPDGQALWAPASSDWDADAEFIPGADEDGGGRWHFHRPVPSQGWPLAWRDLRFTALPTPFRHLGFFPDMMPVWEWAEEQIAPGPHPFGEAPATRPQALNLFGYTGVGTLALTAAGAEVVHVDASKKSVEAARANAALSGMADRPVRWLVDDARKFVAREVRRGRRYDAIILDPPKYGRGPDGEFWRIEQDLEPLLRDCRRLVDSQSRFVFLTVYAVRLSALAIGTLMAELFADAGGRVEYGELALREQARGLLLPTAIFARWRAESSAGVLAMGAR